MLEKIKIKGFRIHDLLVIKFSPTITTIVGRNRSGKSTVFRALKWIAENKPLGKSFIKHGRNKALIKLFADGRSVTRVKSKKGLNYYKLDDEKFEAFGGQVPDEVTKLLNISDVNFQSQHDSPFWLSKTAGQVSRQLNKIVNLDVIDKTLSNLTNRIKKAKIEVEITKDRLDTAKQLKKKLVYVKDMNRDLKVIEALNSTIEKCNLQTTEICNLIALGTEHRQSRDRAKNTARLGQIALDESINQKVKLEAMSTNHHNLQLLIEAADNCAGDIITTKAEFITAKKQFEKALGKGCPIYQCACPLKKE